MRGGFGLPVFALAAALLSLAPLGCTDGTSDEDSEAVEDTEQGDDTGETAVEPEDCDSGTDEDGDGLVDCLDPDCSEACSEICDNGQDDDADGFVDCLDSECSEEPVCLGSYTVTATLSFDSLTLRYGPSVQATYGELGTGSGSGSVVVVGTAGTSEDSDFRCEGNVVAQPVLDEGPFPGFTFQADSCPQCDYGLLFEVAPIWPGSCPVETLPPVLLGVRDGKPGLYSEQDGSWAYLFKGTGTWADDAGDRVIELEDVRQQVDWTWFGDY